MKFTRDGFLPWIIFFVGLLAYLITMGKPPTRWSYQEWLLFITAGISIMGAKFQASPLHSSQEKAATDLNTTRRLLWMLFVVGLGMSTISCAKAPPNLTPEANLAFQNTRVIKGLDLLRDTAIDAHEATPPLLSIETTRKVVLAHESSLKVMQTMGFGWKPVVAQTMKELPQNLPPKEQKLLEPYLNLVGFLLQGIK